MADKKRYATANDTCDAPMLMPCDHCGGVADYVRAAEGFKAICSKCGMQTAPYPWAANAGKVWNARITTHARVITLQEIIEFRGKYTDGRGACAVYVETIEGELRAGTIVVSVSAEGSEVYEPIAHEYWPRDLVDAEGIRWRLWTLKPTEADMQSEPWGQVAWHGGPSEEARAAAEALRREIEAKRRELMQKEAEERRKVCAYCENYHVPPVEPGAKITPAEAVCKKDGHKINSPSGEGCTEWKDYQTEGRA